MPKTPESAMLIRTPAAAPEVVFSDEEPMSDETAARLIALSRETGEPIAETLSEREARRRIAQLEEIAG